MNTYLQRRKALAEYVLKCDLEDVRHDDHQDKLFHGPGHEEWMVLTCEEADRYAAGYIRESLWAFNADFLTNYMPIQGTDKQIASLRKMQEALCEDANELILAMVARNIHKLIRDAISADGRGHFIANYDFNEVPARNFYAYRVN